MTIPDIHQGASCTLSETSRPSAGTDHVWLTPVISPNPVTIPSDTTAQVAVSNPRDFVENPGLAVDKGVSLTDGSGYGASVTTTVGTTVYYRIHVSNTGNVGLTGVTLADSLTNLVAKGCTIPTTLAVGGSFDCKYSATAVVGTTTNTATGDSAETEPGHRSATVTVAAVPGLAVDKGVSLTDGSGYGASVTTTVGTTVYYRIHVSNTGNVGLTGVTLADSLTNLVAKGCTIPTTLAVGGSFDCKYSATAVVGTTTNTATGDSAETSPVTSSATVTVAAVPGLAVDKGVSLTDGSGYGASVTTTVGTTVYYRIHVSNTGNVGLTGVTLADSLTNLVAKGCTIPTTLAVGGSFDCKYSATAVVGTTTNTATGDSAETSPVTSSATVTVAAVPGLAVDKGVSLTDGSGYGASVTTTVGTTVYYRIHVSNTGNVGLTGVTLADSLTNLVAKGCTIPTTLAVGGSFDCKYSATAVVGTTTNTATGDSAETSPVTSSATVTVAAVPGLAVDKGVSLTDGSGYGASVTTTVGTTVYYRIHVSNTGNVGLTGVTLADSLTNLVAKGCTIPTTLAVGGSFDCKYSATAVVGTTTNTATGDSDQTETPINDTATVIVAAAPGLTVSKGVSLTDGSGYGASVTTTVGTTVYYRIHVSNTGNVGLTGVTLTDSLTNLVAKGCTIPTTLAVGGSFDCKYSATAVVGTTTNTATGDSAETSPVTSSATVTVAAVPTPSPSSSVLAETATPQVTMPPTDALGSTTVPSNDSWAIILLAIAGLLASVLVMTPAAKRSRR